MARGSLNETIHWMLLAYARHLLTVEQVNTLKPALLLAQFGVSHIDV